METIQRQSALLRQLTKTDSDPRVRHRADASLLVAEGMPIIRTARLLGASPSRVRAWRDRFLTRGSPGLADDPRTGRPPKLDVTARTFLAEVRAHRPETYGFPVTVWSVRSPRSIATDRWSA